MGMAARLLRMARAHWGKLAAASAGLIGASLLNLATPEVVRQLTARMGSEGGIAAEELIALSMILIGAYAIRMGCRFVAWAIGHLAAWRFTARLTFMIYEKLQGLSLRYFQDKQTGQLMSRMVNDSRNVEILVAHALPDLITSGLVILGVTVMLFRIHAELALLALIPVPLVVYAGSLYSKKVAPLFRINQEVLGEINGALQDNLSGMKEIQAFGQEPRERARMAAFEKRYADVNIRANFANGFFQPGIELLTSLGTVMVIGIGGYFGMRGRMPLSDVVGFLMYLSLFYAPLATLARLVEDVQLTFAGATRVFEVLDAKGEIEEREGAIALPRAEGRIEFKDVSFHYQKEEPVLKGVGFEVLPGQTVALVGPTGVGKTTIVSLLERFYDPVEGSIEIDGRDLRDLTLASLRAQISLVLQDVFLFNGTVAENIAYGAPDASRAQIERAAGIARADGFIRALPKGYETITGERGARLSGGQKQRLAIARAILRDAPILILDEATSSVDAETEAEIQAAIEDFAGDRTVLVIAHRLSTVMRADAILVLEEGRIVERGNNAELIAAGGLYAKLCAAADRGGRLPEAGETA